MICGSFLHCWMARAQADAAGSNVIMRIRI